MKQSKRKPGPKDAVRQHQPSSSLSAARMCHWSFLRIRSGISTSSSRNCSTTKGRPQLDFPSVSLGGFGELGEDHPRAPERRDCNHDKRTCSEDEVVAEMLHGLDGTTLKALSDTFYFRLIDNVKEFKNDA